MPSVVHERPEADAASETPDVRLPFSLNGAIGALEGGAVGATAGAAAGAALLPLGTTVAVAAVPLLALGLGVLGYRRGMKVAGSSH